MKKLGDRTEKLLKEDQEKKQKEEEQNEAEAEFINIILLIYYF